LAGLFPPVRESSADYCSVTNIFSLTESCPLDGGRLFAIWAAILGATALVYLSLKGEPQLAKPDRTFWLRVGSVTGIAVMVGFMVFGVRSCVPHRADTAVVSPAPIPRPILWSRSSLALDGRRANFYGDSVSIESLTIRFQPAQGPENWNRAAIRVSGVVRNASRSSVDLLGYWGEYLSGQGQAIGDFRCTIDYQVSCGLGRTYLPPGYVSDLSMTLPLGPSLARRDSVSFFIRFQLATASP